MSYDRASHPEEPAHNRQKRGHQRRKERFVNRTLFAGIAAAALAAPAIAQQQSVLPQPAAIAATRAALVNGKPIPKSRVDAVVRQQATRGVADTDQLRKAVV